MATVGQQLIDPEAGWKRYDDLDQNITYVGTWADSSGGVFDGSERYSRTVGDKIQFNFTGTSLRLIGYSDPSRTTSADIFIDGVKTGSVSQYSSPALTYVLQYSITGLENKEHSVILVVNGEYGADAIDIDEAGSLKPYQPTTETQLLRVTVSDSSDHDYQLSSTEIDSFVNWFMKHASTDTAGYMLNKKMGTQESKEYLAFDKIISFEVMPLTK